MEIKTKYNINDKIVFKDDVDSIISAKVLRIEIYATSANLGIKYITKYGTIYEEDIIDKNDFLNELIDTNNKKQTNPIEVITMTFTPVDKDIKSESKPKYNIGQLVEYNYKGDKYISSIVSINNKDKNITYKLKHDDRDFEEKEIRPIKLNIGDDIVYCKSYKTNKILYYSGTISDIYPNYVIIKDNDGYDVNILYNQILKRI